MNKKPNEELTVPTRRQAMRVARMIGCSGAHQDDQGNWLPCPTPDALSGIIGSAKKELPKRKRRGRGAVRPNGYERLIERGVLGIDTLPGGGLVSASVGTKAARRDRFARDGDLDGQVQDGTSFERRSRTLSHRAIGRRRAAELRRRYLRLRDLPEPTLVPDDVTEDKISVNQNIG